MNQSLNLSLPNENDSFILYDQSISSASVGDISSVNELLEAELIQPSEIIFRSKGLHFCNLNIRHIVPQIDDLRISMAHDNCPDIFGMCETFLTSSVSDNQIAIDGFDLIRKDRSDTQNKSGGGVILYYRKSVNCKRRCELEVSNIETLWTEISLPNSKPFLVCTVYRPPCSNSEWIDLFEEELSIAQTTGLELIIMGDINIDLNPSPNRKWQNLIELFDLSQLIKEPTRVTESSSTIIDHIYTSKPENIIESFVSNYSLSDHFPVCFSRKINNKVSKSDHITTSYRCFKTFNEDAFISDLTSDLNNFSASKSDINEDISIWYSILLKHLDCHAPYKIKRVKTKQLPDWYNDEIAHARKMRDNCKRRKLWSDYKKYRNKAKHLIRVAKRKYFTDSVINSRDTRAIWQHFRKVNNKDNSSNSSLPDEIIINDERYTSSEDIACKLNNYFAAISEIFGNDDGEELEADFEYVENFINNKVPNDVHFKIPSITPVEVSTIIKCSRLIQSNGIRWSRT